MQFKKFLGRQLPNSQVAAELLPSEWVWCRVCQKAYEKKLFNEHLHGKPHKMAVRKLNKLKTLSLSAWEQHRGAPLDQDSRRTDDIALQFRHFREDQAKREAAAKKDFWGPGFQE